MKLSLPLGWPRALACAAAIAAGSLAGAPAAHAISVSEWNPPTAPLSADQDTANMTALDAQVLGDFMTNTASGRDFSDGVWHNPNSSLCWYCLPSAGTAAATLYVQEGSTNTSLYNAAVQTYDNLVDTKQQPDGGFVDGPGEDEAMNTEFLLPGFGMAYLELESQLSASTKARWSASIARAATYLIATGQTTWYANGNIQERLDMDLWLAWQVTGQTTFKQAYETEWSFMLNPPQSRWSGFGLQITKTPTQADGSDGSGYLAETDGADAPGYDGSYTMAQLDLASNMWVLSRDPRWLRLTNLLLNRLEPHVDSEWTLNALDGTRKNYTIPFYDTAPQVLYADGLRPDLAVGAAVQQWRLIWEFTNPDQYDNPNFYEGLAFWVSLPLLNSQWPQGLTGATAAAGPGAVNDGGTMSTSSTGSSSGSTPALTVTPAAPTIATLTGSGLAVTVSKVNPGATVTVSVSEQTSGVPATAKGGKAKATHVKDTVLDTVRGRAGKKRRVKVRVRARRKALARHRGVKLVRVRVTIASPMHHRVKITRAVRIKNAKRGR